MIKRFLLLILALALGFGWIAAAALWIGGKQAEAHHRQIGPPPVDLGAHSVDFSDQDYQRLSGWWAPGRPGRGVVVLLHPLWKDRRAMLRRARALAQDGFGVLLFDFQSHGESSGDRPTFGWREAGDVRAAIEFVRAQAPKERVGAIGISLGGAAILLGPQPIDLDAVVLESVYPDLRSEIRNQLRQELGPLARLALPLFIAQVQPRLGVAAERIAPILGAERLARPLLLVAGERDQIVPLADEQRIFARAHEPKEMWIIPGTGHGDFYAGHPAEYEKRVFGFLVKYLSEPKELELPAEPPGEPVEDSPTPEP